MDEGGRKKRRVPVRWITLGEAVAVSAVLISGLGLYNSWNRADTPAPAAAVATGGTPLTLRSTGDAKGDRLALAPVKDGQVVQSQTVAFPAALGLAPVETTGDPRIEADWIADAVKKADRTRGAAGDRRLPVLLTTVFLEDGTPRTDVAVYDLGYALEEGGLFGGSHVRLRGLSLVARQVRDGQKRIDARWTKAHPAAG